MTTPAPTTDMVTEATVVPPSTTDTDPDTTLANTSTAANTLPPMAAITLDTEATQSAPTEAPTVLNGDQGTAHWG